MIWLLVCLEMSQRHFYSILVFLHSFFFLLSGWMLISSLCSMSWIWILASLSPLLVPCRFFFISLSVTFISSWVFFILLQWFLWASWSPVFSYLSLIGWLSLFHLVLFLGFCSVISFGSYFFVFSFWQPPCICFCVLGGAALNLCLRSMAYCRRSTFKWCGV